MEDRRQNPVMRQVFGRDVIIRKIDTDFRAQLTLLASSLATAPLTDDRTRALQLVKSACRFLESIADLATHRHVHATHARDEQAAVDLRVANAVNHSVEALRNLDIDLFQRRQPFHQFHRSDGEVITSSLFSAASLIREATGITSMLVPGFAERLHGYDISPIAPFVELSIPVVEPEIEPTVAPTA
jgi:hypothetical protein